MSGKEKVLIVQKPGCHVWSAGTEGVEICYLLFEEDGPTTTLLAGAEWEHLASELGVLDEVKEVQHPIGCVVITNDGNDLVQVIVRCTKTEEADEEYYEAAERYVRHTHHKDVSLVVSVNDRLYPLLRRGVVGAAATIRAEDWL